MGDKSAIEWTDASWNPIWGCSRVSEGCRNCYAERYAARFSGLRTAGEWDGERVPTKPGPYAGLAKNTPAGPRWTGEVRFVEEALHLPLRWKRPRRIFVNSMSDLFHEKVSDHWIDRIFAVMALCPHHTFQILTKRAEGMLDYFAALDPNPRAMSPRLLQICAGVRWPLPNVWLGVSLEDSDALARIDVLREVPAAVRFVSFEPLLEDLGRVNLAGIHWAILGGESGPRWRRCEVSWLRSLAEQCCEQGVRVFVKQDAGRLPGKQGRLPDDLWALKEMPV